MMATQICGITKGANRLSILTTNPRPLRYHRPAAAETFYGAFINHKGGITKDLVEGAKKFCRDDIVVGNGIIVMAFKKL
ncbi:hypothetical protein VNO77_26973 [Canavalia gladiata]|uniref:Uncharacterized protein n=1 Tax=Canavalia gladiata TaxID=3824 RepID=A0AAN9KW32_CANGL